VPQKTRIGVIGFLLIFSLLHLCLVIAPYSNCNSSLRGEATNLKRDNLQGGLCSSSMGYRCKPRRIAGIAHSTLTPWEFEVSLLKLVYISSKRDESICAQINLTTVTGVGGQRLFFSLLPMDLNTGR